MECIDLDRALCATSQPALTKLPDSTNFSAEVARQRWRDLRRVARSAVDSNPIDVLVRVRPIELFVVARLWGGGVEAL